MALQPWISNEDTAPPRRKARSWQSLLRSPLNFALIGALALTSIGATAASAAPNDPANIPDQALQSCINRTKFGRPASTVITEAELTSMTGILGCMFTSISDLTGLELATGLDRLYLDRNRITDLTPISGLTELKELYISNNEISDLSQLEGLTGLTALRMNNNTFTDLEPIGTLTNLVELSLYGNNITDISAFAPLTQLTLLNLSSNQISDLTPLQSMTALDHLDLNNNQISNIDPLSGLSDLRVLRLYENPLSDVHGLTPLTELTELNIANNQIINIAGLVPTSGSFSGQTSQQTATAGIPAVNPVIGRDGNGVASDSEYYNASTGLFTFPAPGVYETTWLADDPGSQPFAGVLTWEVAENPNPPVTPGTGTTGEPIAATGASAPALPFGIAIALFAAAGAALMGTFWRRTRKSLS